MGGSGGAAQGVLLPPPGAGYLCAPLAGLVKTTLGLEGPGFQSRRGGPDLARPLAAGPGHYTSRLTWALAPHLALGASPGPQPLPGLGYPTSLRIRLRGELREVLPVAEGGFFVARLLGRMRAAE